MKKKDALDSLFENINTKEEFKTLMDQLYKRGVETMLRSEMSHLLGYAQMKTSQTDWTTVEMVTAKKL